MRDEPNRFFEKLKNGAELTEPDLATLGSVLGPPRQVGSGAELVRQGDDREMLVLLLDGWACHYRLMANGAKQTISLLISGDLCQPFGSTPSYMTDSLVTLSPSTICSVSPRDLREVAKANPRLETALWWDLQFAREMQNELIASLGRRQASERLASLICEIYYRLTAVGLARNTSFELPLTQVSLAESLGLSNVHINRSFKALRAQGLISTQGRQITISDIDELADYAGFEIQHLQLRAPGRRLSHGNG